MKRIAAVCALALGVASCGDGNPFFPEEDTGGGGTTPTTPASGVPANILNDLDRIDFNAATNTLTVTGLTQDGVPLVNEYRAIGTSFVDGFTTFTGQNDPLGRHATAFVASRDGGLQAGMVLTGGQFNRFFGGTFFERTGGYTPPTAPASRFDVTYVGNYAGGLNLPGPITDLFPVGAGVDPSVDTPNQAGYVTALMFVNVDLNDMSVEGEIFNRTAVLAGVDDGTGNIVPAGTSTNVTGFLGLPDLVLVEGSLAGDGTFNGNLEVDGEVGTDVGDFAGVIGGPDGNAIVGGTTVENFTPEFTNEIEYGVFVLDICTAASTDPICINALAP